MTGDHYRPSESDPKTPPEAELSGRQGNDPPHFVLSNQDNPVSKTVRNAMDNNRQRSGRLTIAGILTGAAGALIVLAIAGLAVVYSGAYNIAATEEHASLTRWAFSTTMHNSVEARAATIEAPADFTAAQVSAGAAAYKSMCEHCHAGPGVERAEWAGGMRPTPPHLNKAAGEWRPSEIFWIVKHGVKMTGMPAFGPTHGDETLWNIAAFVKRLPATTAERYAAFGNDPKAGKASKTEGAADGSHGGAKP